MNDRLLIALLPCTNGMLSDLRFLLKSQNKAFDFLLSLPEHDYNIEEWNYCLSYMLCRNTHYKNLKEAKEDIKILKNRYT